LCPKEYSMEEYNCLLFGPINVTRIFLPLIYGRQQNIYNLKNDHVNNIKKRYCDGGRIINISSITRATPLPGMTRYGASKAAISYFTKCLRYELAPRFGIWCAAVEPGGFNTGIWNVVTNRIKKIQDYYNNSKKSEDLIIKHLYSVDEMQLKHKHVIKDRVQLNDDFSGCINCIIHGLTAYYPQTVYKPEWKGRAYLLTLLPEFVNEYLIFNLVEKNLKLQFTN